MRTYLPLEVKLTAEPWQTRPGDYGSSLPALLGMKTWGFHIKVPPRDKRVNSSFNSRGDIDELKKCLVAVSTLD